ncbi:hypothetical protein BC830DRAFT_1187135 [Chytriomyces sp. MP71]|nr:hypothetical protein BC830DRAFT_1187135 [Chytriomyces sp. MP71]
MAASLRYHFLSLVPLSLLDGKHARASYNVVGANDDTDKGLGAGDGFQVKQGHNDDGASSSRDFILGVVTLHVNAATGREPRCAARRRSVFAALTLVVGAANRRTRETLAELANASANGAKETPLNHLDTEVSVVEAARPSTSWTRAALSSRRTSLFHSRTISCSMQRRVEHLMRGKGSLNAPNSLEFYNNVVNRAAI